MIKPYREWVTRIAGDVGVLDQLPRPSAKSHVQTVIQDVIDAEAPIQRDRLTKVVAGAFGLNRVSEDRRRAIQRVVPPEQQPRNGEDFYWPSGVDSESWRIVRRPTTGTSRPLEEVSLVEIGNAMLVVAEESGGAEREELKREALAIFGGRRLTPAVDGRLDQAIDRALTKGVLRQSNSGICITAPNQ